MENTIRHKPEVETVPQTGSTNNLAKETDIDAISMAIPNSFWGRQVFHWYICQPHPTLLSHRSSRWRTDTGSRCNLAAENDTSMISADAAMFSGTPNTLQTASTPYDSGEHHHVQTGSTNNLESETDIDAISRVPQCVWIFQVRLRSNRRRATSEKSIMCKLPVWGNVSTFGLYLMLFSEVGYCRHRWKWTDVP